MTLPKEDLNLIAQIDARLKHYNLIQPIDTTEGEFNYCVDLDNGRDKCQEQCDYCVQRQVVLSQKQAPIETEQRWNVNTKKNNSKFEVIVYSIESEEQANKIKEAIKQYLSTNKF